MVAVDTNLLVYAHRREAVEHAAASALLRSLAEGGAPWAIPWPCVYEFLSVVTNSRIWKEEATSPTQALAQVAAWLESPSLRLLSETDRFLDVLDPLLKNPRVRGGLVHDARIAALCLAHGVQTLLSRDRDFSLFPALRVENPI
jgi:uncharacterized protein